MEEGSIDNNNNNNKDIGDNTNNNNINSRRNQDDFLDGSYWILDPSLPRTRTRHSTHSRATATSELYEHENAFFETLADPEGRRWQNHPYSNGMVAISIRCVVSYSATNRHASTSHTRTLHPSNPAISKRYRRNHSNRSYLCPIAFTPQWYQPYGNGSSEPSYRYPTHQN